MNGGVLIYVVVAVGVLFFPEKYVLGHAGKQREESSQCVQF